MIKKLTAYFLLVTLIPLVSCQSASYGRPLSSNQRSLSAQSDPPTFDSMEKKERKDPGGTILLIGLGIAAGVAAATLIPLTATGKLF